MAAIGLKYLCWAKLSTEPANAVPTYGTGKNIAKLVSFTSKLNNSEAKLYADDTLAEYAAEFTDVDITTEIDNLSLADEADIFGTTVNESTQEVEYRTGDEIPYGALGGVQSLIVNGNKIFRAWLFTKVKGVLPDDEGSTKGENTSFNTRTINWKGAEPKYGPWKIVKEFTGSGAEASAKAWVNTKLNVSSGT